MRNPFKITLYDKTLTRTGWLNDPISLEVTVRHNLVGSATITVPSNHRRLPLLIARGARTVIEYNGEHLMSGYITGRAGSGPSATGQITCTVQDDLWLVWRMLGWPVPGADLNSQGVKQDTRTGAAETVAKAFVNAQLAHNSVDPIVVATSLGRGSTITVSSRMAVLADALMDAVDKAGIGLSARQVDDQIVLDAYTPTVYPHTLSEKAATIQSWEWSDTDPTITRAIIGGPNVDTSREFRTVIDDDREDDLGYTVEGFVDAQSAENHAAMDAAGQQALDAGGRKSGFKLALSESKTFRYGGNGVHVGDQVTVNIGGQTHTDVLREAKLSFAPDGGFVATPTVGERADDPDRTLASFIASLTRVVRGHSTR